MTTWLVDGWDPGLAVGGWSGGGDPAALEQTAGAARGTAASLRSCSSTVAVARWATEGRWLGPGPEQLRDDIARWCGDAIDEAARLDALAARLEESAVRIRLLEQERLEQERLEQERLEQERLEHERGGQERGEHA